MRVDQILQRLGAELVRADTAQGSLTLLIRASREPQQHERWKLGIEEALKAADDKRSKAEGWKIDISQSYFLGQAGVVRYLWRVVITGDVKAGAEAYGHALLRALQQGVEVTSMPLMGQVKYDGYKGGHTSDRVVTQMLGKEFTP